MPSPDVVFGLTGDVRRNSRALKQLRALASLGATIEVLTFGPPAQKVEMEAGVYLKVLPRPAGSGPRFFAGVHRLFKQAARNIPARIYHASDLYTLPGLHAAAKKHAGQLIFDARERYPFVASAAQRPAVRHFWQTLERYFIRRSNAVFTVSDSIADHIATSYGITRPTVVHNVPPFQSISPSTFLRDSTGISYQKVVLLHQGQIQKDRGCTLLADAMRDVQRAELVFLGVGPLKKAVQHQVTQSGLDDRVRFLDPVPPDALLPVTASADIGITLLEDTCLNHRFALPNKLFEYLMAGLPILASDLPEIRGVVKGFDVGCTVDPNNRTALVDTLQHMVDAADARNTWSANSSQVFETFSWEKASQRFKDIYQPLLTSSASP